MVVPYGGRRKKILLGAGCGALLGVVVACSDDAATDDDTLSSGGPTSKEPTSSSSSGGKGGSSSGGSSSSGGNGSSSSGGAGQDGGSSLDGGAATLAENCAATYLAASSLGCADERPQDDYVQYCVDEAQQADGACVAEYEADTACRATAPASDYECVNGTALTKEGVCEETYGSLLDCILEH